MGQRAPLNSLSDFDTEKVLILNVDAIVDDAVRSAPMKEAFLKAYDSISTRTKRRIAAAPVLGTITATFGGPAYGFSVAVAFLVAGAITLGTEETVKTQGQMRRTHIKESPRLPSIGHVTKKRLREVAPPPNSNPLTEGDKVRGVHAAMHPFRKHILGLYTLHLLRKENISLDVWLKAHSEDDLRFDQ